MPASFSLDTLPQLDDRDVTFLYEIVALAQQSYQRPIKALFTAYDDVLHQHGANADHDSKYFRFLSHAGSELSRDGTKELVKRFRQLLSQVGIQLVLEGGDVASEADFTHPQDYDDEVAVNLTSRRRSRRRASFNDSNLDATWASRLSQSGAFGDDIEHERFRASSDGNRYTRTPGEASARRRAASAARSEGIGRAYNDQSPVLAWTSRPDKQQLHLEAAQFLLDTMGRKCLYLWRSRAAQVQRRQQDLERIASNHDKRTLLKQSMLQMRGASFDSRFWHQQERRAGRARDLFLLTKAFTHWAQAASDEVLRTSLARRHILRTRYFNAWRDISAINELKCRRVPLNKWFTKWRSRSSVAEHNIQLAIEFREEALLKNAYWQWFWSFCDRKAPVWKDVRLKVSSLDLWKSRAQQVQEMDLAAAGKHNSTLQRKAFATLHGRLLRRQDDSVIAASFHREHLLHKVLNVMRRKIQFRPRELRFNADYDARIQRRAFSCLQTSMQLSRQAALVDVRRVQSNAFTAWNDQLRVQMLRLKIDDRLVLQALYRWVLQQRLALFTRVMDHRQKSLLFQRFRGQFDARRFQLHEAAQLLHYNQDRRLLKSKLSLLYQKMRISEQRESTAIEVYNTKVLPKSFAAWVERSSQAQQLSTWADQARFYCLTHSSIKRWREATTESQRRRRRDAYATVRRRQKMSIARQCLQRLHERAVQCENLNAEAVRKTAMASSAAQRSCFVRWHELAEQWRADEAIAQQMSNQDRLSDAFGALLSRFEDCRELSVQAEAFAFDSAEKSARKIVRKLVALDFGLKRNIETATAWHDRKFLQRRQAIMRYWSRRAFELREARLVQEDDSPIKSAIQNAAPGRQAVDDTIPGPSVSMLGNMTSVDHSDIDLTAATVPGYLRTPTRKRNRARFKSAASRPPETRPIDTPIPLDFGSSILASTTPAALAASTVNHVDSTTPRLTPFQRRLRAAQASTTPRSPAGGTPYGGASSLFMKGLAETPYGGASALMSRDTTRSVRFGRTVIDEYNDDDEEGEDDPGMDESPSRPRT